MNLWKLYFASLLHGVLVEYDIRDGAVTQIETALQREGLVRGNSSLASVLSSVLRYVRSALRPQAIEGGIELDPLTRYQRDSRARSYSQNQPRGECDPELLSVDHPTRTGE